MIQKEYGGYTLSCDTCSHSSDFDTFDDAVEFMRAHGWKSYKDDYGDWVNVCSDCSNSTALEDFE